MYHMLMCYYHPHQVLLHVTNLLLVMPYVALHTSLKKVGKAMVSFSRQFECILVMETFII